MARGERKQTRIARRGLMLVLSSPSGAGKTTLSRMLLKADRNVELSVSVTTRQQRRGEIGGKVSEWGRCVADGAILHYDMRNRPVRRCAVDLGVPQCDRDVIVTVMMHQG